jgi:aspartyl-tRNA(Asn)/glutamyl-tRNA(Gln) amidotransferase subunit B
LPITLPEGFAAKIAATLPELPDDKKERFMREYGLSSYDAGVLVGERASADFFETVAKGRDSKLACNWVTGDFFAAMNRTNGNFENPPVSAANLGGLIDLIGDGTLSGRLAKEVFELMVETGKAPSVLVEERGLKQVTDTGAIEAVIEQVMAANPDKVAEYRSGKDKLFGFFVGQVMKASQGKANPAAVNELLKTKLAG